MFDSIYTYCHSAEGKNDPSKAAGSALKEKKRILTVCYDTSLIVARCSNLSPLHSLYIHIRTTLLPSSTPHVLFDTQIYEKDAETDSLCFAVRMHTEIISFEVKTSLL